MKKHAFRRTSVALVALAMTAAFAAAQTTGAPAAKRAVPQNLDEILKNITTYEGGLESEPYWDLRNYVLARKDSPVERKACEEKLAAFLGTKATLIAKTAVCRQLRIIGSPASVPALEKMLLQKETADIARYALEKIPAGEAEDALIGALGKTNAAQKKGIIVSLGQ